MLKIKQRNIDANYITRSFWLFIVLLVIVIGLYGYNYTNAYLTEKKYAVNSVAAALQKRIDSYRYLTDQIYDRFGNLASQPIDQMPQETRLRPDVYYVERLGRSDAVIFGNHDSTTSTMIANISDFLDSRWGEKAENYSMYYLNGQDNSLSLVTTQSFKELTSRLKENYLTASASELRAEMLQQVNMLDQRESFSNLRKHRFQNTYSFSIRTTFNQPGHLATVIAFDLPINDIVPLNMASSNFLLLPDENGLDGDDSATENTANTVVVLKRSWVEFNTSLLNSPLKLVYRVSVINLVLDLLRNNLWLLMGNLLLLVLSMTGLYFIRQQYIRPSENMAAKLEEEQALNREIVSSLPCGLLVYDFANNSVIASNKIAEHLMPHLNLQKITHMAEQHHGVIQATVNNEVYEVRLFSSLRSTETYLFIMSDQDKEVIMNKRLQQASREYDKNVQARKLMLHNLGTELNQPVYQMHSLIGSLHGQTDEEQQKTIVKQLHSVSSSVLGLIDNITLLTRLETQNWQPANHSFTPSILIEALLLEILPAIHQKGLTLFNHFHLSMDQQYVGDTTALGKIISLLLHYAVITTAFGKVSLVVKHEATKPEQLVIHINDTGAGMTNEEIDNLTYPFVRQPQADRFSHASGLTFFLCNQLCRKLNGQLEIRSKIDIGTRYTVRIAMELQKKEEETTERLLDDVTVLLKITSEEIRSIVTNLLDAYGASCIVAADSQNSKNFDFMITDDPQQTSDYTLLVTNDVLGWQKLNQHYVQANYNLHSAMIDAILALIEQRLTVLEQDANSLLNPTTNDGQYFERKLESTDYYSLFIDTVPDDVKKLYTLANGADFTALSQTVHRLKGVFAMLNLLPAKQLCESLEQHIADGDAFKIENNISQIDFFVSRLLQQGSQPHE
ncbi:phosphotransferase RcsD [Serratia sp. UGAL515B_01]|uniref:phosphotransferase RcsD n=1 Tax=Serratia sp. UGAL515B_01 TaxID=2986763 RepID=UPI002954CCA5|nr:phosphotransferase RcsD [Serratia sp. UGAL515B_01]WON75624.1 phosphotransferase RcsD [Serratia sp. UGAL515B_01]